MRDFIGPCPNCKNESLEVSSEGIKGMEGECWECGLYVQTMTGFLTLEEYNSREKWMFEGVMDEERLEQHYKEHGTYDFVPFKELPFKQHKKYDNTGLHPYWFRGGSK